MLKKKKNLCKTRNVRKKDTKKGTIQIAKNLCKTRKGRKSRQLREGERGEGGFNGRYKEEIGHGNLEGTADI